MDPVAAIEPCVTVKSDAAGRIRLSVPAIAGSAARAVAVENALDSVAGVRGVQAFPLTANVLVWYDPEHADQADVIDAVAEASVSAAADGVASRAPRSADVSNGDLLRIAVGGIALALLGFRRYGLRQPALLGTGGRGIAAIVTIFTGYPFMKGAAGALAGRRGPGTDALVSAATVASLLLRENVVALMVLWLLNIGEYLQALTLRRTQRAIADLLTVADGTAWVRLTAADGTVIESQVPLSSVHAGDIVIVFEQATIPVDGTVIDGEGIVDQAAITGESLPVMRREGDGVHAGSVNLRGKIAVRAEATGSDTVVGRIIARVQQAQQDQPPIQTIGSEFSRRFVPASFAAAGLTWLVTRDVRRAMTMLLVACPCAVGLATPTAVSSAIGSAARRGILIKGGSQLEAAGRVDAVVFDKTGTLTVGKPIVTEIISLSDDWTPEQVLAYVASSEVHSTHPLAEAVIRSTEQRKIEIPIHEECEVLLGLGMRVEADGRRLLLGNPALMARYGVDISAAASADVDRLQKAAQTPLLLAVDARLVGIVSLQDQIRPETPAVIAELRAAGVKRIVMLTGDHPATAEAIAQQAGISEWRADTLPEDKQQAVEALRAEGYVVAMVGDGTNDAPALAAADVGIAMGMHGTDVAVETADIALVGDDLTRLLDTLTIGRGTLRVIRQNYGMAIAVNGLGLAAGASGALSPVLAAIAHNASSVAVSLNSARLISRKEPEAGK